MIMGMRDHRCRESITQALEAVAGVKGVDVNLYRARAVIVHAPTCEPAALVRAVEAVGYGAALDLHEGADRREELQGR